jgi:hypothetical protein
MASRSRRSGRTRRHKSSSVVRAGGGYGSHTILMDGLSIPVSNVRGAGSDVLGHPYVWTDHPSGPTFDVYGVAPGISADVVVSDRVAIDPGNPAYTDLGKQPFDARGAGQFLGTSYDASLGTTLPATIAPYANGTPKTVWFYRGLDALVGGGGYPQCHSLVKVTVFYGAPPPANFIRPTSFYAPQGKRVKTTADINYNVFPLIEKPAAASVPNLDQKNFFLRDHTLALAAGNTTSSLMPTAFMDEYGGTRAQNAHAMLFATIMQPNAAMTEDKRRELVNRVVLAGLDIEGLVDLNNDTAQGFTSAGGFAMGGKYPWWVVPFYLGEVPRTIPPQKTTNGRQLNVFSEDDFVHWSTDFGGGTFKPLFGSKRDGDMSEVASLGSVVDTFRTGENSLPWHPSRDVSELPRFVGTFERRRCSLRPRTHRVNRFKQVVTLALNASSASPAAQRKGPSAW